MQSWRAASFESCFVEVVADVANVVEEVVAFDGVDDGDGDGAGERAAAEGGAVHAGSDGVGGRVRCRASRPWGCRWRWAWRAW